MFLVYLENGFAIAVRGKVVGIAMLSAQLCVVVDHVVSHERGVVMLIVNHLLATDWIHNGQPNMAQHTLVDMSMHH